MTFSCDADPTLNDFSGFAPLFPLPNVVLFPHALLPLQIYEPRYRQMTADVLEGERLIAMGLMRNGWEKSGSNSVPAIHRTVGLGKIIAHEKLEDGRYYLVLRGIARAALVSEQHVDLPYRIGELELCSDVLHDPVPFSRQDRVHELTSLFSRLFPQVNLQQLFLQTEDDIPLATLCDILLGSMPLASEISQQFLEELNADVRSQMLLDLLERAVNHSATTANRKFPPNFSSN